MITFELVTLSGIKFAKDVYEVILPTPDGEIAIFPTHMELVSLVIPGIIKIRSNASDADSGLELYATNGGIVEIDNKRIRILVDEADHSSDVNEQQAEEALKNAQKLAKEAPDDASLEKAMSQITLQKSRLRVAGLRKKKSSKRY